MARENLGARHLTGRIGEVQRVNNFIIEIQGLPAEVSLLIQAGFTPNSSNEIIEIQHGNSKIKLPGTASFENGEITILDSVTFDTEKVLSDWREKVYNPKTDAIGLAEDFKRDALVTMYAPNGTLERSWKLEGVWPSSYNPGSLDNESSDKKLITVTLTYDYAYRI